MKKNKIFLIRGIIYNYDIIVGIGCSMENLIKWSNRKFNKPFTEHDLENLKVEKNTKGRVVHLENSALVLWVKNEPKKAESVGILSHEIFHACDMVLTKAGLKLTPESDEAWAHQIQWLTEEIYKKI